MKWTNSNIVEVGVEHVVFWRAFETPGQRGHRTKLKKSVVRFTPDCLITYKNFVKKNHASEDKFSVLVLFQAKQNEAMRMFCLGTFLKIWKDQRNEESYDERKYLSHFGRNLLKLVNTCSS
jgi:hypothetical protein